MSYYNDDLEYASLLIQEGHKEEASRLIRDYLDRNPDDPDAWYLFAAAAPIHDYAIRHLQHALDIDPFHAKARAALVKVRAAQEREANIPPPDAFNWQVVIRRVVMSVAVVIVILMAIGVMILFQANRSQEQTALATARVIMTLAASAPTPDITAIPLATLPAPLLYEAPFDLVTWANLAGSDGESSIEEDSLTLTTAEANRFASRYVAGQTFTDAIFAVNVNKMAGPLNDGAGLALRVDPDQGDHYLFLVSSDGYAAAFFCEGWCRASLTEIIPWTPLDAINQGVGVSNVVQVTAEGADFQFMVNDALVAEFSDDRRSEGRIGVGAFVFEPGPSTVEFEDVTVRLLP